MEKTLAEALAKGGLNKQGGNVLVGRGRGSSAVAINLEGVRHEKV